nr:BtrH N-terminal domain-containing protein [Micromonospora sp. DSM 115978]
LTQCSPDTAYSEAMVAGLAGGIGFMYFVFHYADTPPMLTIVAQHHPEPWVPAALSRLGVPVDVSRSARPPWPRLRAALEAGRPVFCTVDKSRLPWHGLDPAAAVDPYPVLVTGHDGSDTVFVLDEVTGPRPISTTQFEAAWSAYRKGRHEMIVPTGPAIGAPDVAGGVASTVAHLTGPVLGNSFDVNFGFSGMAKLASQLRDTTTKSGWARRFGEPVAFFHGVRRLYDCIEVEYTSPGATRPLYAEFLAEIGQPEAAALIR